MRKIILSVGAALLVLVLTAKLVVATVVLPRIDAGMNEVIPHEPWPVSAEAQALHDRLAVADLHADTLLWARNPLKRHDYGHTDLPRLREGRVALQVFTAVTKSPSGLNYHENEASTDDVTRLAIAQGWPLRTWGSLKERASYQADRLHKAARKDNRFEVITSREQLADLLERREADIAWMGGVLGIEGAHPLEGDIAAIDHLYKDGYRLMGLQHFFDNELGGSLHGTGKRGLTAFGQAAIDAMDAKHIIIDVAHSSPQVVKDVLSRTSRPVVISHTGINGLCPSPRNIEDELMAEIAARGGLIGIGFWDAAVCDATPDGLARTIRQAIAQFGEDHIALGSDFDGTVPTYFDASELAALTHSLKAEGLTDTQIEKVMGGNQIRFFLEYLPNQAKAVQ